VTLLVAGCGGTDRLAVEGTVTFQGEPIAEGSITLRPIEGTQSPTAGSRIVDGKFRIDADGGPRPGTFRVEIAASRPTGRKIMDPETGQPTDMIEQYIPPRYNRQSELTAEITPGGPNELEFNLD
jgi:hypothetical protein